MILDATVGNSNRGPTILLCGCDDELMLNWETTPEELERLALELRKVRDGIAGELLERWERGVPA